MSSVHSFQLLSSQTVVFSHLFAHGETSVSHNHVLGPLVLGTIYLKVGEKESIMSQSIQDRETLSRGRNFYQGLGKSLLKFLPLR